MAEEVLPRGSEFLGVWRTANRVIAKVTGVRDDRLEGTVRMCGVEVPTWWDLAGNSKVLQLTLMDRVRENEMVRVWDYKEGKEVQRQK